MVEHPQSRVADDPVEGLLADCLARLSRGEDDPLEMLCDRNPQHASELRRRRLGLDRLGLATTTAPANLHLGSFAVLRELGRGGMGAVYLAHQSAPVRRLAAVKVIGGHGASPQAMARFLAERQALARLVHPNIAQVLEAGATSDGQPWYAMEFVDGVPLKDYCDAGRLGVEARLGIFLQLCDAVHFAHQQGVLHRDLKPGNVLVCERNGRPLVKVIDFGLAKALVEPFGEQAQLTEAGQILGTPEYMSPEQAMPTDVAVDIRTDVYALGSMLYELCAGVLPFNFFELRRQGFQALQHAVCEQAVPPPSVRLARLGANGAPIADRAGTTPERLVRRLRGDLDWIALRSLAKERDRRYAAVSELGADIRRHLQHLPVQAGPPGPSYQMRKFVRRHRAGVAFAATLLAGLLLSLVIVTSLLAQRNQSLTRFDALQVAIDFAALLERADDGLWRTPERLQQVGDLWPASPSRLPMLQDWLTAVQTFTDRLPDLRRQLAALEALGEADDAGMRFAAPRDRYLHNQLVPLIHSIESAASPDGCVARVRARRDWAADLARRSLIEPAAAWQQAVATIADPAECPAYAGLRISPQLGFVPLGRDPVSRLYEFAFLQAGCRLPERVGDGWAIAPDTCMVFVLVPGGKTHLGVRWPDPRLPKELERPLDTEYVVPTDGAAGGEPFPTQLDPFLIAKYEMTHGQWERLMGSDANPSSYAPSLQPEHGISATHPVNTLDARMADEAMRRLGLALPTSAQWQHAARAGSEAPWWTGFAQQGWYGSENLADASLARFTTKLEFGECDTDHDDGFCLTAPVDSGRPNPFGLHHVLGNVREWSRDPAHKYKDAMPRPGDGLMQPLRADEVLDPRNRDVLGGSFMSAWLHARSTMRTRVAESQAARTFGLRPACHLR